MTHRRAYTLIELMVVLAIIALLAAVILPGISSFRGDSRQRAAADAIRGELAVARARAREEGRPYRVALSEDGTRIRRAPESADGFAEQAAADAPGGTAVAVDYALDQVTAKVVAEQDVAPPLSENGWVTVATLLPDGTCRETTALVQIVEHDGSALYVRLRGVTGSTRVVPNPGTATSSGGTP